MYVSYQDVYHSNIYENRKYEEPLPSNLIVDEIDSYTSLLFTLMIDVENLGLENGADLSEIGLALDELEIATGRLRDKIKS